MATYRCFEDLPVWQASIDLADGVYSVTESEAFHKRFSLRDQMERSGLSISSNIAEGFERGTREEFLTFLYIARGSSGELRSQLAFSARRGLLAQPVYADLHTQCLSVSKQLGAFTGYLRDSEWKGQRDFTAKVKASKQREEDHERFMRELEEISRRAREKRGGF